MDSEDPPLHRPIPRRPFDLSFSSSSNPQLSSSSSQNPLSPGSANASSRTSDFASQLEARLRASRAGSHSEHLDPPPSASLNPSWGAGGGATTPGRSRSILNLTTSTLFGIYGSGAGGAGTGYPETPSREYSEPATPWGTGAVTPLRRESVGFEALGSGMGAAAREGVDVGGEKEVSRLRARGSVPPVVAQGLRVLALFVFGVSYGVIIRQLHYRGKDGAAGIAPVQVVDVVERGGWTYLGSWGLAGVGWGLAMPWVDLLWEEREERGKGKGKAMNGGVNGKAKREKEGVQFLQLVRIVGGFIGIAFAARKLAWRSTLQASGALALVNPALWYLFDRTRAGFALSLAIGIAGTLVLLAINPDVVPAPATHHDRYFNGNGSARLAEAGQGELFAGVVSYESVGVATWIASVLFCSCICFGNIGRRLSGWVKES